MRDLIRDWESWTLAERVTAAVLLALPLVVLPGFYLGTLILPH